MNFTLASTSDSPLPKIFSSKSWIVFYSRGININNNDSTFMKIQFISRELNIKWPVKLIAVTHRYVLESKLSLMIELNIVIQSHYTSISDTQCQL